MTVCFKERQGTNSSRSVTGSVDESRKGMLTGAAKSILASLTGVAGGVVFVLALLGSIEIAPDPHDGSFVPGLSMHL